jgi:hypothetical protein
MDDRRIGLAGLWGIAGVLAILAQAIVKLAPIALEALRGGLAPLELAILAGWIAASIYSEGYRGFHLQFSPRVIARAQHLEANPRPLHVALAPLYCMGLIHATRKRLVISWTLTLAIVAIVIVVRRFAQPWRGIVDAGVVVGLALGVASIFFYLARGMRGAAMPVSPDAPL